MKSPTSKTVFAVRSAVRSGRAFAILFSLALLAATGERALAQALAPEEQAIASFMASDPSQHRPFLKLDPILEQVARARAKDMAVRNYVAHVNPDGFGPNYLVRQAGYQLPAWWGTSPTDNFIESISAGYTTASDAWQAWMGSTPHRTHLLALDPFYANQTSYGVGFYYDPSSTYQYYWVVITAPPQPAPPLAIASPSQNAQVNSPDVTVSGTTSGTPSPASVACRIENAGGIGVFTTATGTASWTVQMSGLAPGPNTLRVRSLDGSGNTIAEATTAVTYIVLSPLTVTIAGSGTVSNGFAGTTQRGVGSGYSITATPASGFIFAGWTGGITSSSATLKFTMQPNLALQANFIGNPFVAAKGLYNGLLTANGSGDGFFTITSSATGLFSAKLVLNGTGYSLKGQFDAQGNFQTSIPRTGLTPLAVSLHLDLTNGTNQVTGTVSDGTVTSALSADQLVYDPLSNPAGPGRYTVVFVPDPNNQSAAIPRGYGWATVAIAPTGLAQVVVSLADGAGFTLGVAVSKNGTLPVYAPLYSAQGSVSGTLAFRATSVSDLDGTLAWTSAARPNDSRARYPAGFSEQLAAVGSKYAPPASGTRVLSLADAPGNAIVEIGAGGMSSQITQPVTLASTNLITAVAPNPAAVTFSVSLKDGKCSGAFLYPVTPLVNAPVKFKGVVLQKQNAAFGYFLGMPQSGYVSLAAP
jgi:List-Bact-rpt repeat protein/cysteine-rich secretory family protein